MMSPLLLMIFERMEGKRGSSENFSALSAGPYTTTFLVMVTVATKQKKYFLVMVHSALFNTVI
jgi:hypothetical protein